MNEHENRSSPLTLVGDGLLLLCALTGLAGSFLSLYATDALGSARTPLDLCAARSDSFLSLAVVLALAALVVWSLPRFRWVVVTVLAAALGLYTYTGWDTLVQGAGLTIRTVTTLFSLRVSWGQVFQYDPELTSDQEAAVVRLFLSLVLVLLALILGWAVVRAKRWWIVLLFTLPPLLPGLLADLYPNWLPFMALSACWCVMLLTDLCKWAAPSNRGRLTLIVLPCVAAVLAVITFLFPREGYTRPQWARHMETRFYDGTSRLADFFSQFDGPFAGRVTYVGAAEEADLASAGPLNYSGRTVLRVSSDYEGRLYLRGSSLADYEDGVWKAMTDEVFQEAVRAGVPPRVLFFPAMTTEPGPEHTVTVDNVGAVGSCVYAPYFLTVQELEDNGMSMVNDSLLARRQGRWTHTLSFVELPEPHPSAQTGEGTIMLTTWQAASADFGWYTNFVYTHYLDVPEEYRDKLAQACIDHGVYGIYSAALDGGTPADPVETAQQVAALLDQFYEYDPSVEAPPTGVDPVMYFLTDSQRGYCMHYASAATLMLRSLGIPARYVSGFTVESVTGRQVTVPDRAAHAWVEVWVSGFGWYPVEVTPADAFEWYGQGMIDDEAFPSDLLEESETPEPTPTTSQDLAPSEEPSVGPADVDEEDGPDLTVLFIVLKVLAAVAGTAALFWLGQYLPKAFRAKRLHSPDRNHAALDGYGYLKRMERWGGRMDERAVELAQKARFSQHTLTREELAELRQLVDIERERLCVILNPLPRLVFRYFWGMPVRPRPEENRENTENDHENGA